MPACADVLSLLWTGQLQWVLCPVLVLVLVLKGPLILADVLACDVSALVAYLLSRCGGRKDGFWFTDSLIFDADA